MKNQLRSSLFVSLALVVALTGCKKDSTPGLSDEEINAQIAAQANDESQASFEMDASIADATLLLESYHDLSGYGQVLGVGICDAELEYEAEGNTKTVVITYNGDSCNLNKVRTGKVTISMDAEDGWKDAGTSVNISYEDFKVVRISDGKTVTINGNKTYTNISGGLSYSLSSQDTLIYSTTSAGVSIKFDNETARQWQIARKYSTYITPQDHIETRISGMHTDGNITGIAEWGTNRFGNAFVTKIESPVVISHYCSSRVSAGVVTHSTAAYSATVTFGLNAQGEAASACPGEEGNYYLKLQATTINNKTFSGIFPY